jgi:hypothetical protein
MHLTASVNPRLSDLELLDKWTEVALESYWRELVYEAIHYNDTSSGYIAEAEDETSDTD